MDNAFGAAVRALRTKLGISLHELADRSGVDRSNISNIENGRRANLTQETVEKIARGLNIPMWIISLYERRMQSEGAIMETDLYDAIETMAVVAVEEVIIEKKVRGARPN